MLDNWANFRRYGLPTPVGLLRADAHRPPFRDNLCEVQLPFAMYVVLPPLLLLFSCICMAQLNNSHKNANTMHF